MADLSPSLRQQLEKNLESVQADLGEAKDRLQATEESAKARRQTVEQLERDQYALQLALGLVDPPVMYSVEAG